MEINVSYLKNDFTSDTRRLNAKLGDIVRNLQAIKVPKNEPVCGVTGQPDCKAKIDSIMKIVNGGTTAGGVESKGLCSTLSSVVDEVNEMVNGYEWAENYAMSASVNLKVDTTYTENSMGGGNSNTVREDNIYASMDDSFTVKYIAIYADGKYMYNMILNDENKNQRIDSKIEELKASGVIPEGANIKLSMGITKEQPDGSLGDIGWLPQVDYNPDTRTSGIEKTSNKKYEKITPEKYENQDGFIGPTMPDEVRTGDYGTNYDAKFTPLNQVFYDEKGNEVNLANYLTDLEKSIEETNNKNGERVTYQIASYSGGAYQNSIRQNDDGGMSEHNIEWVRKNLDTDLIRDGLVPHITVTTTTIGEDGSRNVKDKILFLNKEDITLPEDRIDLMSPSVTYGGKNYTSTFVSRKDLPDGYLKYSNDGGLDEIINTKKVTDIKISNGKHTVRFSLDGDKDTVKKHIDEYIRAFYLEHPDKEITVSGTHVGGIIDETEKTDISCTVDVIDKSLEFDTNEDGEVNIADTIYSTQQQKVKENNEKIKELEQQVEKWKLDDRRRRNSLQTSQNGYKITEAEAKIAKLKKENEKLSS